MEKSEEQLNKEAKELIEKIRNGKNIIPLILKGYDVNMPYKGSLPLNEALVRGRYDVAKILIEHGADTNATDSCKAAPIVLAKKNKKMVALLHKHGAYINGADDCGNTALFCTNESTLKYLVKNGANVNKQNDYGYTALMGYAASLDVEAVKYLLEHGAHVNICSEEGNALNLVAQELGVSDNAFHTRLDKITEIIKCLVDAGIDLNHQDQNGNTALHLACMNNKAELVKYLIDKGADLNKQNDNGQNALGCVGGGTNPKITKDLLEAGSDVNMQRKVISPSLISIAKDKYNESNLENMKMLIEAGVNINIQESFSGKTPLIQAVRHNNKDFVKYLCGAGADLRIKDDSGKTACDHAADRPEILEILRQETKQRGSR